MGSKKLKSLCQGLEGREWNEPSSWQIWVREGKEAGFDTYSSFLNALDILTEQGLVEKTGKNRLGRDLYDVDLPASYNLEDYTD